MGRIGVMTVTGVCAFFGGLVGQRVLAPSAGVAQEVPADRVPPPAPPPRRDALDGRFEDVAREVGPAVVSIEATKPAKPTGGDGPVEESGSGVLVRWDGIDGTLALTNNHVIDAARPGDITVHLADGRVLRPARVWSDPESDIAALLLKERLPTAAIGSDRSVRVGQWVLAFGSPFGLSRTVTHGIISARGRGQISLGSTIRIKDFLQTDAAINPGSSGGPLVNLDGEVVGINTAIASKSGSNSGVAFAIPIGLAVKVARQLVRDGRVPRGYLGVQLAPVMQPAQALKLGLKRVRGALVEVVYADTPASQAGLRPDDVVLRVGETPVRDENHLINLISDLPAGRRVRLEVWRGRALRVAEVRVGDWAEARRRLSRR